jgi:hypothetical protein
MKRTASVSAHAAQESLGADPKTGPAAGAMLSQREAARRSNHNPKALRQAIRDGVLSINEVGKIEECELTRFLAWLGTCRHESCEEPARYPNFCCSRSHAVAEAKRTTEPLMCARPGCTVIFRPRPQQLRDGQGECCSRKCAQILRRQREEEAGKLKGERVICDCGCGEARLVFPSQRASPILGTTRVAAYRYLNAGHWARHRWKHGIDLTNSVRAFYLNGQWSLDAMRRHIGTWKLEEARHHKGAAEAREVAEAAIGLVRRSPELSRKNILDVLIAHFEGKDAVKAESGERRAGRDPEYRKARARIERRLKRGFTLLGEPPELASFIT